MAHPAIEKLFWPQPLLAQIVHDENAAIGLHLHRPYCFHPGHTWIAEQGRATERVGIDRFAANSLASCKVSL